MPGKCLSALFAVFILLSNLTLSAQISQPTGGGSGEPHKGECLSESMREQIKQQLRANIQDLTARGILQAPLSDPTTRFIWPVKQAEGYNQPQFNVVYNYVDHSPTATLLDFNGGTRTYNGHKGTDIALRPFPWNMKNKDQVQVIAAAPGVIIGKSGSITNDNSCVNVPGAPWNAVFLEHDDGTVTWYGHMKYGSLTSKAIGESVTQGEYLGIVASSGNSDGPHLHFEVYKEPAQVTLLDPWVGPSNATVSVSLWQNQRAYTEKEIFMASTHSETPVFGCYTVEDPKFKNVFCVGDPIVSIGHFKDFAINDPYRFVIKDASGAVVRDQPYISQNNEYTYSLYDPWVIPPTNFPGKWKLTVYYGGKTAEHDFYVEEGSANANIELFNMCNTPAFTTNIFSAIGVGKHGVVWAGTPNQGLYRLRDSVWDKFGAYLTNNYQDIKSDRLGGIIIGQSGTNGSQSTTGGVLYFADTSFTGFNYYGALAGSPSRNVRSIFVDTSQYYGPTFQPLVWSACYANITGGVSSTGGIGRGINSVAPNFSTISTGVDPALGTGGVFFIGGNSSEVWSFANNNYGKSQILRHNVLTNGLIGTYDTTNVFNGVLPGQFAARAIYFDAKGRKWITVNSVGVVVQQQNGQWKKINFPELFGASPVFNNNALAGDTAGNVYIGTTAGLIMYRAGSPLTELSSYKKYTVAEGLPSSNVRAICVDTLRKKLLIGTDNGIVFWKPVCSLDINAAQNTFSTVAGGTWGTTGTWCNNLIPNPTHNVIVRNPVTITSNTTVKSVKIIPPGSITVNPGIEFKILNQ